MDRPHRPLRRSVLCALALIAAAAAHGETAEENDREDRKKDAEAQNTPGVTSLETITVVGTRTERVLNDVPATISVISAEEVEQQIARDIADLVRFEPGVSVGGTGSRFGLGGFTIRGITGNRVLTTVDGIRVPEEFSFGPFLSARRDFVDVDGLERAEIARGPISSLYGSDALGGVVALQTKGPRDYLEAGRALHLGAKAGYSSADDSTVGTFTAAAGNDWLSGLVLYTRRDASETENQGEIGGFGPERELPDPQDITIDNIVAKIALEPNAAHRLTLSLDYFDSATETQVLSDYGTVSAGVTTDRRDADDSRERTRLSLAYEYSGNLFVADRVRATAYTQTSETVQLTEEDRTDPAGAFTFRTRDSFFEQQILGGFVQLERNFDLGPSNHQVIYGFDYFNTENSSLRTGATFAADGTEIPEFFPFPTRDFPLTEVTQLAFFLQDEISLLDGRLMLSPGLRYDNFDASAEADEIYLSGNPGSPNPEDYSDEQLTLRFGALLDVTDTMSIYGRYSEGFRAPPFDDVNVGFSNFIGGYKTIANPNLESELSRGWESGVRVGSEMGSFTVAYFYNEYENFIESFALAPQFAEFGGIDPADGLLTFQSINRQSVVIDGVEATAGLDLGIFSPALEGLRFNAAVAYADGRDLETDAPINTVDPLNGVFGLGYDAPNGRWGADVILTVFTRKEQEEIDPSLPRPATDGFTTIDLLGRVDVTERITLNAGVFNVTDQTYVRWADTAGVGNDALARFTQPGLNFGANLRVRY